MKVVHEWRRQTVAAACLLFVVSLAWSAHSGFHKVVDGVGVYFAVVSAEMVRDLPRESSDAKMHGGVPVDQNHIMVAVLDEKTGDRIVGAEVTARVRSTHGPDIEKRLESMTMGGSLVYGNFFSMGGSAPFQIELSIRIPGRNKPVSMKFDWARS